MISNFIWVIIQRDKKTGEEKFYTGMDDSDSIISYDTLERAEDHVKQILSHIHDYYVMEYMNEYAER